VVRALEEASESMKEFVDVQRRKELELKVRDKVWLDMKTSR
jgi:hypothetical protein